MSENKSNLFIRIASILAAVTGLGSVVFNVGMICTNVVQYIEHIERGMGLQNYSTTTIVQLSFSTVFSIISFVFLIMLFVSTFSNGLDTLKIIIKLRIIGIVSIISSLVLSVWSAVFLCSTVSGYNFDLTNMIMTLINGIINIGINIFIIILCVSKKKNSESRLLDFWFIPVIISGILCLISIIRQLVTMVGTIGFFVEYEIYEQIAMSIFSFLYSSISIALGMAGMILLCFSFKRITKAKEPF